MSPAHPHIIPLYLVTPQPRLGQVWSEKEDIYSAGTFKLLIRQQCRQSLAAWRESVDVCLAYATDFSLTDASLWPAGLQHIFGSLDCFYVSRRVALNLT